MRDIPNIQPDSRAQTILDAPDKTVSVREVFGLDIDMQCPAFSEADERVQNRLVAAVGLDVGNVAHDPLRPIRADWRLQ